MGIKQHLSREQQQRLMAVLSEDRKLPVGRRAYCLSIFIELMLQTGIRTDELCHVKIGHLHRGEGVLNVFNPSKGSERGTAKVPEPLLTDILNAVDLEGLGPDDLLLAITFKRVPSIVATKRTLQRAWRRIAFRAFGDGFKLGLHCLRHTGAFIIFEETENILHVKRFLRHKSVSSTEHYIESFESPDFAPIINRALKPEGVL